MGNISDVIGKNKLVLIDFSAEWCGSCQTLDPVVIGVQEHFEDNLNIVRVDVDRNAALATSFHIQSVPTLILYKEGNEVWRQAGLLTQSQLVRIISYYLV